MTTYTTYDLVIIYNGTIARSPVSEATSPFGEEGKYASYNAPYAYFLEQCKRHGLRAGFATTDDIVSTATVRALWTYHGGWKREIGTAHMRMVFDKFSILNAEFRKIYARLTAVPNQVQVFHNVQARTLFDDKLNTYRMFSAHTIPTVAIDTHTLKKVEVAQKQLLRLSPETAHNGYVIKDRFGSGGHHVFARTTTAQLFAIGKKYPKISFVLQPRIEASGFQFSTHTGNIDLRVIICDGVIVQSYIRIPKQGEFRANASQGGTVVYLNPRTLPKDVVHMSMAIDRSLPSQASFYALDFMKNAAGHLYLIEGNVTPGLNWFDNVDEKRSKKLIRDIVQSIQNTLVETEHIV